MFLNKTLKKARIFLILLSLLPQIPGFSQQFLIKGFIKDALSDERVPFASISFINSGAGKLSDSAGIFAFRLAEWPANDTLLVTYVGYKDYKLFLSPQLLQRADSTKTLDLVINLERGKLINEVVVRQKIDRGYLMWKRIVKHKPKNDRYRFRNFSYEMYNKLELDLNRINKDKMKEMGLLKPFGFIFDNVDTSEGPLFYLFTLQKPFLIFITRKVLSKQEKLLKAVKRKA
jgi:hypothetical protein